MLRFKPEVRIGYLSVALVDVLSAAAFWSLRTRIDVDVNSIDDGAGVHVPNSRHGQSLAVDLDTAGDKSDDLRALAEFLWRALPAGYDVVYEGDHVHVEYDVHRPPMRALP